MLLVYPLSLPPCVAKLAVPAKDSPRVYIATPPRVRPRHKADEMAARGLLLAADAAVAPKCCGTPRWCLTVRGRQTSTPKPKWMQGKMGGAVRILMMFFIVTALVAIADGSPVDRPLSPTPPSPLPGSLSGKQHRYALSAQATPAEATAGVAPGLRVEGVNAQPGPGLLSALPLINNVAPLQWLWVVALFALGLSVWRLLTAPCLSFLFVLSNRNVDRGMMADHIV